MDGDSPANLPVGLCSYCGARVYSSRYWYTVHTFLGDLRLCDICGERDPYALAGGLPSWKAAGRLPASYRLKPRKKKGK